MSGVILIGADIVPTNSNLLLFNDSDREQLIGKTLCKVFDQADFVAMNLETPLCDCTSPILKAGPCLSAPQSTINGIKNIVPDFLTLANNHIMDQGEQGLLDTVQLLKKNGIAYAGVGRNLEEAAQPYITEISGRKLGIYCCAEHEFSIAGEDTPGANPYNPLQSFDHVKELRQRADYVVVLYHGGKEHYRYPSPQLQQIFHKFADVGANLVIAQHTHCIGCKEIYNHSTLIYGQGNFIFDNSDSEYWKTSLIIKVEFSKNESFISYIPIVKNGRGVRIADERMKDEILNSFEVRSENIKVPGYIQAEYKKYAQIMEKDYLVNFHGRSARLFFVRAINKLTSYKLMKWVYSTKQRVIVQNMIECEAHRELAAEVMKLRREK